MLKRSLTNNLGYKVLALVIAVVLWMIVLNAEDPVITREFTNIAVTEENVNVISEAGKAYSYADGVNTVNVKVSGHTSLVNNVTRNDIKAVVDLSKISDTTGAVPVDVSCERYPSLDVTTEGSSGILRIEIEDLVRKSLSVQVTVTGTAAAGRYVGSGTASPNLITVSGPESVVSEIESAQVKVPVGKGTVSNIRTNSDVQLLDSSGNEVSSSVLTLSESRVSVDVPIYKTKEVPIEMGITGEPAAGYSVISSEYEPKKIVIAGPDKALKEIDSIKLSDYDITGGKGKLQESISVMDQLEDSLPRGIVLTDPSITVALAVDIEKSGQETFSLPVDQIKLTGAKAGYTYKVSGLKSAKNVDVVLNGTSQKLKEIDESQLSGVINVSNLTPGRYSLSVLVDTGSGVSVADTPQAAVIIAQDETEE